MLETLENLDSTHGRENLPTTEPISREDSIAGASFLACLLDGEGSIQAAVENRSKKGLGPMIRLAVQFHNNHYMILNRAAEICQQQQIPFCWTLDKRMGLKGKSCGSLHVAGKKRIKRLLTFIRPYLTFKQKQADLMLELIEYRESLVLSSKKDEVGDLSHDPKILHLISEIKREKHDYPSLLEFSRQPNQLLVHTKPSTTTRSTSTN